MNFKRLFSALVLIAVLFICASSLQARGKMPDEDDEDNVAAASSKKSDSIDEFNAGASSASETSSPQTAAAPESDMEKPSKAVSPATTVNETDVAPPGSKIETVWIWQETKDCLWRLAKKHYKDPWQWKKIYLANRNGILDPNVIFPKQQIIIPPADQ